MGKLTGKKILMVLSPKNFCDEEFFKTRVVLQAQGAQIVTASKGVEEATGMEGGKAKIDIQLGKVKINDYNALIFIGGSGAGTYLQDEIATSLAKEAVKNKILVGAICLTLAILAKANLLKGKKVTSDVSARSQLAKKGAIVTGKGVQVDGRIVTACSAENAEEFGEKLAEILGR